MIMSQLISRVIFNWGWRQAFLFLIVPLTSITLFLSNYSLPEVRSTQSTESNLFEGYRQVLSSRSALSCLLGNMLTTGAWTGGILIYMVSFLREAMQLSLTDATTIFSIHVIPVIIGNYIAGYLANRFGLRQIMSVSSILAGLLIIGFMNTPDMVTLWVILLLMSVFTGVIVTGKSSIILTQVPDYRGTMTSLNTVALQLGGIFGAALGGLMLSINGWFLVGATYGLMHIIAALFYYFGVKIKEG